MAYETIDELLDGLLPFLQCGISDGDLILYISDDHGVAAIADGLTRRDQRCAGAIAAGQLVIVSSRDAFFANGRFNVESSLRSFAKVLDEAVVNGRRSIRAVCEMTYLLADVPGIERAGEFETRANAELFALFPFLCVCPMNLRRDVRGTWAGILRSHPTLYEAGEVRANPDHRFEAFSITCADGG